MLDVKPVRRAPTPAVQSETVRALGVRHRLKEGGVDGSLSLRGLSLPLAAHAAPTNNPT